MESSDRADRRPTSGDLKQVADHVQANGGNFLVTGDLSPDVASAISRQMAGATDHSRKRIFAVTDTKVKDPDTYLPDDVTTDDPDVWFIDQRHTQRSVSAIPGVTETDLPAPDPTDPLTTLRRDITEAISTLAQTTDLAPRELRLSFNSLAVLLDEHSFADVEHFLTQILSLTTTYDGVGHYFLLTELDCHRHSTDLQPLFDAHIQFRNRKGHPLEQRWHLPEFDRPSPWLTFTSDW